ncbi:DEAD/DEAH box helicase [Actinomycetospora lemnae]|uniref:RNA helicase n=1 Tax=Actinomycetospora lemnae TaxID=3019891 RepID=A0ABT5SX52_9PSEU|nr:DEAD/DEAH box helicase [Actinomycetospora sp. DW7H6]MDD7967055.1 DEAD/DEAH box helicase [Actinomycetospora sp. DW7H6]
MTNAAVLSDHDVELVDVISPSTPEASDASDDAADAAAIDDRPTGEDVENTDENTDETSVENTDETDETPASGFAALGLAERLLPTLVQSGFDTPTPIQAETIPLLLSGRDVLGLAQTGTGKTAAFALPILSAIDPAQKGVQALVLTPTRELAIQVAEAVERLGAGVPGLEVVQLYGGAPYGPQLHGLRRGGQIVVGTPGRVADHLEKGTLDLSRVAHFVLDEADEMLQMGFLEEVEALFERLPDDRQVALFSATMPAAIREVSRRHLNAPAEVSIKSKTQTAVNTRQRYVVLPERQKADALSRILQVEDFDACLVFVRTRQNTTDVTEALHRRGFAAVAISGDLSQPQREKTIGDLRAGKIDVLVATDVAARGLDVDRISLVVNHDLPPDSESYVHRIGRTGRAGRSGEAISFVTRGQIRTMRMIEGVTKQKAEEMSVPGTDEVNEVRKRRFADRITGTLDGTVAGGDAMDVFRGIVGDYVAETGVDPMELAASLAKMVQGDKPLLVEDLPAPPPRGERPDRKGPKPERGQGRGKAPSWSVGSGTDTYRIDVGHNQRVRPGAIVGAIANEAGLDSAHIGHIDIRTDHTLVELPADVPGPVVKRLQRARVAGRPMGLRRASGDEAASSRGSRGPKRR